MALSSAVMAGKLTSVLAFVLVGGVLAWLVVTHQLFAESPLLITVQVGAVLLMLWARATFGSRSFHAGATPTQGGLVTTGPYRFWRHPIYAAILYFVWAGQVESPTTLSLAAAGLATLGLVIRMLLEEHFLSAAYPEYPAYCRRAKRFVPFVV